MEFGFNKEIVAADAAADNNSNSSSAAALSTAVAIGRDELT